MNNLTKAIELAQRTANREGRTMLVLNLNPLSPLYVVRDYDERLLFSDKLVAVIEPMHTLPTMTNMNDVHIVSEEAYARICSLLEASRKAKQQAKNSKLTLHRKLELQRISREYQEQALAIGKNRPTMTCEVYGPTSKHYGRKQGE